MAATQPSRLAGDAPRPGESSTAGEVLTPARVAADAEAVAAYLEQRAELLAAARVEAARTQADVRVSAAEDAARRHSDAAADLRARMEDADRDCAAARAERERLRAQVAAAAALAAEIRCTVAGPGGIHYSSRLHQVLGLPVDSPCECSACLYADGGTDPLHPRGGAV